jgi:hypothetical protein
MDGYGRYCRRGVRRWKERHTVVIATEFSKFVFEGGKNGVECVY